MHLPLSTLTFPEIKLQTRDAHKLRGYFGDLFQEHSPLLHNHYDEGKLAYRYPLVQYKVLNQVPTLVGLGEGAKLLIDLFLQIKELQIEGKTYPILSKNLQSSSVALGLGDDLYTYSFQTLWLALNQENHRLYCQETPEQQAIRLKKILIANILAFYKSFDCFLTPEERILAQINLTEKYTQFKNQKMLGFVGSFTTNALLPNYIGLGKSPARGFGSITNY
jgi:hypothetical protein